MAWDVADILASYPDLDTAILADPYLEYYYTFDDLSAFPTATATTNDFVLDQSGKPGNRNLQAINRSRLGGIYTTDSGKLPVTADDSMLFNFLQFQWITFGEQLGLLAQHAIGIEHPGFRDGGATEFPAGTGSAFMAWLAYIPFDLIADGPYIEPWPPPGPPIPVIATWSREFGVGNYGAQLGFRAIGMGAVGVLYYTVGGTNADPGFSWEWRESCAAGEWIHFCSAIEYTGMVAGAPQFKRRIWVNGELDTTLEGDETETGAKYSPGLISAAPLSFGTSHYDDVREGHGKGMVDGVAYFSYTPPRASWGIIAA